jgi:hypothetical protein
MARRSRGLWGWNRRTGQPADPNNDLDELLLPDQFAPAATDVESRERPDLFTAIPRPHGPGTGRRRARRPAARPLTCAVTMTE